MDYESTKFDDKEKYFELLYELSQEFKKSETRRSGSGNQNQTLDSPEKNDPNSKKFFVMQQSSSNLKAGQPKLSVEMLKD
jgi:hypothetical protein